MALAYRTTGSLGGGLPREQFEKAKAAVNKAVEETKSAIRKGVHDIRDTVNAASMRAHADAAEAKEALKDSKIVKHSDIVKTVIQRGCMPA